MGEANLTFSGSVLNINGTSDDTPLMLDTTSNNGAHLRFRKDGSNQHFVGSGGGFSLGDKEDLSFRAYDNLLFATGNSSTERMRISSEGYVTKPNHPSFHATKTNGDAPANSYVVFNNVNHNNGSHYNASDGKFTAPVTGVYYFSVWHYTGSTSAISFRINGSQYGAYSWDGQGGFPSWVCPMTAGDYAQIFTVNPYGFRGTADYHNAFNGFLIG